MNWLKGKILTYVSAGLSIAMLGLFIALVLTRATLADVKKDLAQLQQEAASVLLVIRDVSGNPKLRWTDTPVQIRAVGDARDQWRRTSDAQTAAVEVQEAETARYRAIAESRQRQIASLVKQRDRLADDLSQNRATNRQAAEKELSDVEAVLDSIVAGGL